MYMCMCVFARAHVYIHVFVCKHTYIYVYMCMYTKNFVYTFIYQCMYIYIYIQRLLSHKQMRHVMHMNEPRHAYDLRLKPRQKCRLKPHGKHMDVQCSVK